MKTKLPEVIRTEDDAKSFICELKSNIEHWDFRDAPDEAVFRCERHPQSWEIDRLKHLHNDLKNIPGFNPVEYLESIDGEKIYRVKGRYYILNELSENIAGMTVGDWGDLNNMASYQETISVDGHSVQLAL